MSVEIIRQRESVNTEVQTMEEYQAGKFGVFTPGPGVYLRTKALYVGGEGGEGPEPGEGGDANYSF